MFNKNIEVVQDLLRYLNFRELRKPEVIASLVRAFGIVQWGPAVFGDDEKFKNPVKEMAGIYQTPDQIARALVYLSDFQINSYLEIGVFQGGNFLFTSEYLRQFNPEIVCMALDPTSYLNPQIRDIITASEWMHYLQGTSNDVAGRKYDLVMIDGDHSKAWITKDYENVGKYAKICMIHDIQEVSCPAVSDFWRSLKKGRDHVEFLNHTSPQPLQGIGIIRREE